MRWITAKQLEGWADGLSARAALPSLIRALLHGSAQQISTIRFPDGDQAQIHGFDGHLVAATAPYVGGGESFWELSTEKDYVGKANDDISVRSQRTPPEGRASSTFVFATPRTWNRSGENELQRWEQTKRAEFGWKAVIVIDAVILQDWLEKCLPVAAGWARRELHSVPQQGACSTDEFWEEYSSRFELPLTEKVLLCQRDKQSEEVLKHLASGSASLVLRGDSPDEVIAFAIATIRTAKEEVRQYLEARAMVVDTDDAARELAQNTNLVFIPRGDVTLAPLLARVAPTIVATGRGAPDRRGDLELDRPTTQAFAEAIQTMGVEEGKARLLAYACGRSTTILIRTFPNGNAPAPQWVANGSALIPALLAGAWDSASTEDKNILCGLAGTDDYEKYEAQLRTFYKIQDAPIDREENIWKLRAPVDAFVHLGHLLGKPEFDRLRAAAHEVFSEIDPALNAPPAELSFDQPKPRHSSWLRDGLATTVLLIAVHYEGTGIYIPGTMPQAFVDELIRDLPGLSSDWRLIASLRAQLPLLAEAAPRPFLVALELLLQSGSSALSPIFREGGFFSPFSPHTYVLWALETLAWDPEHLTRVTLILAKLANIDPGGTISNRPINSLLEILLPWHPNTNASQGQRLAVLDLISREVPEIGWQLITKLLPTTHSIGTNTAKPKYREAAGSEKERLTHGMLADAYTSIIDKALSLADKSADRWTFLTRHLANFGPELRSKACGLLEGYLESAAEQESLQVWSGIREEVNRHIAFKEAKWALPPAELQPLSQLVDRFAPANPIAKLSWLFDDPFPEVPTKAEDPDRAARDAREQALTELVKSFGMAAVFDLVSAVKMPQLVATALRPFATGVALYDELLNDALARGGKNFEQFASALSAEGLGKYPDEWPAALRSRVAASGISGDRFISLVQYWPDNRCTWDFIASFGEDADKAYWSKKSAWPIRGETPDLAYAAERYLAVRRAVAAIQSLGESSASLPIDLVFRLFDSAVAELNEDPSAATGMFKHYLEQTLDALDKRGEATIGQIARVEWAFLPLFEHGQRQLRLYRLMADDPNFYVSLICSVFRADGEGPSEITEEQRGRARAAYQLLSSFGQLPGFEDNKVDAERLRSWVKEVRRQGEEVKRKAMTEQYIGHVLAHAPNDPEDEAWPHRVVRDLIESLNSREAESGISVQRINMRGVYSKALFEGGKQERGFAETYRNWAKKCGAWPLTANLLNEIARSWDSHADWEDKRAREDKMRD